MSEDNDWSGNEAKDKVLEFVRARFPAAQGMDIDDGTSLLDSGVIDSLGILDLVEFIEETFGIQASDEDLVPENFESVSALVRYVESKH